MSSIDVDVSVEDNDTNETINLLDHLGDFDGFKQAIVDAFDLSSEDEDGDEIDLDEIIENNVLGIECDEYSDFSDMDDVETFLETSFDDGDQALLFLAWCEDTNQGFDDFCTFENNHIGEYTSGEEYAKELAEENDSIDELPHYISSNIDWEGVWADLSGDYLEVDSVTGYGTVIFTA